MATRSPQPGLADDPRKLRECLSRTRDMVGDHELSSVVVGVAGSAGEILASDIIDFIESSLRMEDSIVRITGERAVLFLTDVGEAEAIGIVERLLLEFRRYFHTAEDPEIELGFYVVGLNNLDVQVRDILTAIFPSEKPRLQLM